MLITLIRHTTVGVPKGTCYGATDVALADTWQEEFAHVLTRITQQNLNQHTIYASPLSRCRLLAEHINSTVVFDNRLKEMNFGQWECRPWDAIPRQEIDDWIKDLEHTSPPDGESLGQVYQRTSEFLSELEEKNHNDVIVITHGGVIRCMLANALNLPIKNGHRLEIDYGSFSAIRLNDRYSKVEYMNV